MAVLLALTLIVVAGLPAAVLLDRRECPSPARLLGSSFLLGSGLVWLILLAMSIAGVPWSRLAVTAVMLLVTIALWLAAWKAGRAANPPAWGATWIDLVTLGVLAVHGFIAARKAVGSGDFWAIWGLKGRVFFEHGGIDWAYLRDPFNAFQHSDYPLLLPLNHAFVALHDGVWSDRWMGLLTTFYAAALVLIVRDLFGRELPRRIAALATLGVAAIATSPWIGTAEGPMVAYGAAGLLLLRSGPTPLGAILLGLAACAKNEGLALVAAAGVALLLSRRGREVWPLWPAVVVASPWLILRGLHGLEGYFRAGALDLARVVPIFQGIARQPSARPLLWVALVIALVAFARSLPRERFVLLACLMLLLAYLAAYLATSFDVLWQVAYSWPRLIEHVSVPLAFVALMISGRELRMKIRK